MNQSLTFLFLILTITISFSQEDSWEEQLIEKTKGKKVIRFEEPTNYSTPWVAFIKVKKKIGVYSFEITEDFDVEGNDSTYVSYIYNNIKPKYDQIKHFNSIKEEDSDLVDELQGQKVEVAEVILKNKKGIIVRYGDEYEMTYLDAQNFFQAIDWENKNATLVPVKNNKLWGIYDWYHQSMLLKCQYKSINDFPKTDNPKELDSYSIEIFRAFNKQKGVQKLDLIDLDKGNGDGVFKARSKESKKWGMYQYLGNEIIEIIPMKYDSLYHFPWNGRYTAVFNNDKVGFYLSHWVYNEDAKQSVPCIYEDYKRYITDNQIPRLAVKKNGKWGWVDWLTGEEKSEFKFDSPENLPYPHYNQKM